MRQFLSKSYLRALLFSASVGLMGLFYGLLNHGGRPIHVLSSPIDDRLPLIPAMAIPYIGWYPYIIIGIMYLCLKDRSAYYRTLIVMNIGLIVCYLIYFFYQTTVIRPEVFPDRWDRKLLLDFVYGVDNPYNCFPSIHALHSYVIMRGALAAKTMRKSIKAAFVIGAMTIIVSTLLVKQHVIYDALGSMLLGEIAFILVTKAWNSYSRSRQSIPRATLNKPPRPDQDMNL
ncbi:phosphatase PAP2 family protein [Paenibacillus lutimineralis]|uniref:Phosphatase PAP2 family protein n=1 Tax=Paenibacillus lutimineralis TaxID=2707005 RepID=A0A3Q9I8B3_9BACL|nr:phosphatase PAP2 family protein [Paenibacillus lutimineralis]AZS13602.1 phosphatase PAP2 family protein [Paenibacillus lutimineralis]